MKRKSESKLQGDIVVWFNNNYCLKNHNPRCYIFSVPNEMAMQARAMMVNNGMSEKSADQITAQLINNAKNTGFRPGVSDLIIIANTGVWFIELKCEGNYQQQNQKDFEKIVTDLNQNYVVIKSLEQFKDFCDANFTKPYKHTNET